MHRLIAIAATALTALEAHAMAAAGIEQLKPLHLSTSLETVAIVTGPSRRDVGLDLARRLEQALGRAVPVLADVDVLADPAAHGTLIAIGQYADNALLERLYYDWQVIVDGARPGAGGHLLQTVHNPNGWGINVVVVGGSDDPGVARAAERLVQHVRERGDTLPRLFEIVPGIGADALNDRADSVVDPARTWPSHHLMEVQKSIAEAAMLHLYTGREDLAVAYRRALLAWLRTGWFETASDDFDYTIIAWDLMEESPVFSDDERLWITRRLWETMQVMHSDRETNHRSFGDALPRQEPRANHQARYAASIYFGARYFRRHYGLAELDAWLEEVRAFWRPQMTCFSALEGSASIAHITLIKAVGYALAEDIPGFLSRDVLGVMARGELMRAVGSNIPRSGGMMPYAIWCLAAHRFDAPDYLRPIEQSDPSMAVLVQPWRAGWDVGRSFWDGRRPPPTGASDAWVLSLPFDRLFYDGPRVYGPRTTPFERSFELLVFKDPTYEGRQHLAIGGHGTGSYSADTANAITALHLGGRRWLSGGGRVATVHKHCSLVIVRDGETTSVPAFARLDRAEVVGGVGISHTALVDYNGTDWHRHVINVPNRWFLVIDAVDAKVAGDYLLESRWREWSRWRRDGDDLLFTRGDQALRITGTGWEAQYIQPWLYSDLLAAPLERDDTSSRPPVTPQLARRWTGRLEPGDRHTFVHLLSLEDGDAGPAFRLTGVDDGACRVHGPEVDWDVTRDGDGRWQVATQEASSPPPARPPRRPRWRADLQPQWQYRTDARLLAATALNDAWALGLAGGRVVLLGADGTLLRSLEVPGNVFALCAADLDGDGREQLLAGSDTGAVHAFDADGAPRWQWQAPPWQPSPSWRQSFGPWRAVISELMPIDIDADGRSEVLAAGTYCYVLDGGGRQVAMYDEPAELEVTDLVGNGGRDGMWRTPERTLVLAVGDVDGDGLPDIVGDNPRTWFVRAWSGATMKRLAVQKRPTDRFLGNALKVMATFRRPGDDRHCYVAGCDAYLHQLAAYRHPDGLLWQANVGAAVEALIAADLDADDGDALIAGTGTGQIQVFGADGGRRALVDIGEPVGGPCALTWWRDRIWAGTVGGRIVAVAPDGRITDRAHLPGLVDHLRPRGDVLLAASTDGHVAAYRLAAVPPGRRTDRRHD